MNNPRSEVYYNSPMIDPTLIIQAASVPNNEGGITISSESIAVALCGLMKAHGVARADFIKNIGGVWDGVDASLVIPKEAMQ